MTDEHGIVRNGSRDCVVGNGPRDTSASATHLVHANHAPTTPPSPPAATTNHSHDRSGCVANDAADCASIISSGHSDQSRSPIHTANRNSGEHKILAGIGNGSSAYNKLPNNHSNNHNHNNNNNNNIHLNNGNAAHAPVGGRLQFFKGTFLSCAHIFEI